MRSNAAPSRKGAPSPSAALDFSALSAEWRVLTTSPAWPEVSAAMQRLEAPESGPTLPQDVSTVREYAAMLRREADTVLRAIVVGHAVGSLLEAPRVERIRAGVRALSEGFHFDHLPTPAVNEALRRVGTMLNERFAFPFTEQYRFESSTADEDMDAVLAELEAADRAPGEPIDRGALVQEAWNDAARRLLALAESASEAPLPTLAELMCEAADIGPGRWFDLDPARMTIEEWSALAKTVLDVQLGRRGAPKLDPLVAPPRWAMLAALHALGFGDESLGRMKEMMGSARSEPEAAFLSRRTPARPQRMAVVVRRPGESRVAEWRPIPELAALVLDPGQMQGFDAGFSPMLPPPGQVDGGLHVAVELTAEQEDPPGLDRVLRGAPSHYPRIDIFAEPPRREPVRPFVVAPQGPQDLLRGIMNLGSSAALA